MKRIAWLLLAVICTTFVQVPRLEPLKARSCGCSHCRVPGSCGMPGCGQAAGPVVTTACEPSRAATVEARRERPSGPARMEWLALPVRPAVLPILPVAAFAADGPRVPLFRAHCSLLI
jgi:hypothetical protein